MPSPSPSSDPAGSIVSAAQAFRVTIDAMRAQLPYGNPTQDFIKEREVLAAARRLHKELGPAGRPEPAGIANLRIWFGRLMDDWGLRQPRGKLKLRFVFVKKFNMPYGKFNCSPFALREKQEGIINLMWAALEMIERGPRAGPPVVAEAPIAAGGPPKPACPVEIGRLGEPVRIRGEVVEPLPPSCHDVVVILARIWPEGMSAEELRKASGTKDPVKAIDRIRKISPRWESTIVRPGKGGRGTGYSIARE